MKIISFRIKNYRSIKDSGICYLSGDNITILAGKNESGKTAILEALEDFNRDRQIREDALPLNKSKEGLTPEIIITFEIGVNELNSIYDNIGIEKKLNQPTVIQYTKLYPNKYMYSLCVQGKRISIKDDKKIKEKQNIVTNKYNEISRIYSEYPQLGVQLPEMNLKDAEMLEVQFSDFSRNIQSTIGQITNEQKLSNFTQALNEIIEVSKEISLLESVEDQFLTQVRQKVPNFILFSSFDDIFPSEVTLDEAPNNELIKDLATISDLDLELIESGSISEKTKHKEELNITLKDDYKKFWTQDLTNLHVDWDSTNLYFLIKEGEFYPPKMRSKGKQWHLAFYVRVSARAREDVPNVILIDEPGLFLHAKAQEDVLRKLEDSANDVQIIFSTHSPYLINIEKLNRIRLVSRATEEEGTLISNKIHKGADKETLTPVITAIGLDLSLGLDIAKDNNIIFEGITDYYYLCAFVELLKFEFKNEVHFIPGAGADKTNLLASLMIGWGFNYCIVLDNDAKGRRINDKLLQDFGHTKIRIILVPSDKDGEIEDLFSRGDFIKYVLDEKSTSVPSKKNSQIIKQKGKNYDKVLLAKAFFEKATKGDISFTATTTDNFKELLKRINNSMFQKI